MTISKLKSIIWSLARSQWFYGRLYRDLEENKSRWELKKICTKNNVKDSLDLVMLIEW